MQLFLDILMQYRLGYLYIDGFGVDINFSKVVPCQLVFLFRLINIPTLVSLLVWFHWIALAFIQRSCCVLLVTSMLVLFVWYELEFCSLIFISSLDDKIAVLFWYFLRLDANNILFECCLTSLCNISLVVSVTDLLCTSRN